MDNRMDTASLIRRFVEGDVSPYEFDDFLSCPSRDPAIEAARLEINALPSAYPPETDLQFTSDRGSERLLQIAEQLESNAT